MTTETMTMALRADTASKMTLPEGLKEQVIRDTQVPGFVLRVHGSGATYAYSGRISGTTVRRTVKIGDALRMTLKQARDRASELRSLFTQGRDPVAEDAAAQAAEAARQAAAVKLGSHATDYLDRYAKGKLVKSKRKVPTTASVVDETKSVNRAVKGIGADVALDQITVAMVRKFKKDIESFSGTTQKKAIGALQRMLKLAVEDGILDVNVAKVIAAPSDSPARERYLSQTELAAVWHACGSMGTYGSLVRFLVTTPVRVSIAANLRLAQIDHKAETFTIDADAEGNKARVEWVMPLTKLALETIEPGDRIFAFTGRNGAQVAISSVAKKRLDEVSGVKDWTLHDIRRTVETLLADAVQDVDVDAAQTWTLHKRTGIKGVYQMSQRRAAVRNVASQWSAVLSKIIGKDATVVQITPKAEVA